jgi:hypothetical protein
MAKRIGLSLVALLAWALAAVVAGAHPAGFGDYLGVQVVQSVVVFGFAAEVVRLVLVRHFSLRAAIVVQLVTAYVGGVVVRALFTFSIRPAATSMRLALGVPRGPWMGVLWFVFGNVLLPFVMIGLVYWRAATLPAPHGGHGDPLGTSTGAPA